MKENSIEEDIKSINKGLYELEDSYELHQARWAKRIFENIKEKLDHILSGYKRALKENERYQESDYEKICLENNELSEITDRIQNEYNDLLKENEELIAEIEFNKYAIVVLKKMLQKLLEGRK